MSPLVLAALVLSAPASERVELTLVSETVTSTGARILTMSELDLYRLAETARKKAKDYKIDLEKCRADEATLDEELRACRASQLAIVTEPAPAVAEDPSWRATPLEVAGLALAGAGLGFGVGGVALAYDATGRRVALVGGGIALGAGLAVALGVRLLEELGL